MPKPIFTDEERKERKRANNRKYMAKVRAEQPEKLALWRASFVVDAERQQRYSRQGRENIKNNPARLAAYMAAKRIWEEKNKDAILRYKTDWALKQRVAKELGCSIQEIPSCILDARFAILNVKRKLQELKNENAGRH